MSTTDPPNAAGSASAGPPRAPSPAAGQLRLIRSGANWFIWIAGLSLVNSALFAIGSNWAFFLGLGATQFVDAFGKEIITGTTGQVMALVVDVLIAGIFVGIALIARNGTQWAFIAGMVLVLLDALLLAWVTDWAAVAFHGLALYFMFRGFQASRRLRTLRTATELPPGIVPPITPG
jgi:hypothetical protein